MLKKAIYYLKLRICGFYAFKILLLIFRGEYTVTIIDPDLVGAISK